MPTPPRHPGLRRLAACAATILAAVACSQLRDAIAPGTRQSTETRLAISARLLGNAAGRLDAIVRYLRADGTRVELVRQSIELDSTTSTRVPLGVDLAPCLADDAARVPGDGVAAPARCRVVVELRLAPAGAVVDELEVGPLLVAPAGIATPAQPVVLSPSPRVVITDTLGRPVGPLGVPLLRGTTVRLLATVTDSATGRVLDRPIRWSSSAPAATVDATGLVTAQQDGAAVVRAQFGAALAQLPVTVTTPTELVTLALTGAGGGTVTPSVGPPCVLAAGQGSAGCQLTVPRGTALVLAATPAAQATFAGFTGGCVAQAPTCTVTVTGPLTVAAAFPPATVTVSVTPRAGSDANGRVRSTDGAIDCVVSGTVTSGTCVVTRPVGTTIELAAAGDSTLAAFDAWGGDCAPAAFGRCTRTLVAPLTATVAFRPAVAWTLVVGDFATATARLTLDGLLRRDCVTTPTAPNGRTACLVHLPIGRSAVVTAIAGPGSTFSTFDAGCEQVGPTTCTIATRPGETQTVFVLFSSP
jgi:hypothetical protein